MGFFSKPKLEITEVAQQISILLISGIDDEKMKGLSSWGVDPSNMRHKLEILLLGIVALKGASANAIADPQKAYWVADYTVQYVRMLSGKLLSISENDFNQTLQSREEDYTSAMSGPTAVMSVGIRFAKNIGSTDAALQMWGSEMFAGMFKANLEFLQKMDAQANLIP